VGRARRIFHAFTVVVSGLPRSLLAVTLFLSYWTLGVHVPFWWLHRIVGLPWALTSLVGGAWAVALAWLMGTHPALTRALRDPRDLS
jgi:hypothetical protein